jgi:hypothetical protein
MIAPFYFFFSPLSRIFFLKWVHPKRAGISRIYWYKLPESRSLCLSVISVIKMFGEYYSNCLRLSVEIRKLLVSESRKCVLYECEVPGARLVLAGWPHLKSVRASRCIKLDHVIFASITVKSVRIYF